MCWRVPLPVQLLRALGTELKILGLLETFNGKSPRENCQFVLRLGNAQLLPTQTSRTISTSTVATGNWHSYDLETWVALKERIVGVHVHHHAPTCLQHFQFANSSALKVSRLCGKGYTIWYAMGVSRNSRLQIGLLTKRTHQNHQMKDLKTVRFFVQAPRSASKGQHTLVLYKKQATSSVPQVLSGPGPERLGAAIQ